MEWELNQSEEKMSHEDAIKYCENLGPGWRTPTDKELESIVDRSKCNPASKLPDTVSSNYWSSTANADNTDYAWYVNFNYGYVYGDLKSISYYVRAVRGTCT